MKSKLVILIALCCCILPARAAGVEFARIFSDHMVLQRSRPITVWGTANPGEAVAVQLEHDNANAIADAQGKWSAVLPARAAGGPYKLLAKGKNSVELSDILIGDLWVASGQSNMEMPVDGFAHSAVIKDSAAEIAAADYPQIRLIRLKRANTDAPLDDLKEAVPWQVCSPETVGRFSAVGYFFGRDVYQHEKVPIGLIDSSYGGTPAESWISLPGLSRSTAYPAVMAQRKIDLDQEKEMLLKKSQHAEAGIPNKPNAKAPTDHTAYWQPASLYNGMIAPLLRLPIRGVIWYQGESNTSPERAPVYEALFKSLIVDWRTMWHQPDMPFLFVQLAAFGSNKGDGYSEVREAQRRALTLRDTGMAVALDVGEEHQIHFAQKQVVGTRLALLARKMVYGEDVVASGPMFRSAVPEGAGLRVTFDDADGLQGIDGPPTDFEVAAQDKVFVPAQATVKGNTLLVQNSQVASPVYVRYGWQSFPKNANLINKANLPASPFTSVEK